MTPRGRISQQFLDGAAFALGWTFIAIFTTGVLGATLMVAKRRRVV